MARKSGDKPQGLSAPAFVLAHFLSFLVACAIVSIGVIFLQAALLYL
jgi:hypothetical protein